MERRQLIVAQPFVPVDNCTSLSKPLPRRYRRDARPLDEDEELWFNDDDDDDDGEAVEKSRMEEELSDSYGKYMEAKKGKLLRVECP